MQRSIFSATALAVDRPVVSGIAFALVAAAVLAGGVVSLADTAEATCLRWDSYQELTCAGAQCTGSWNELTRTCHGVSIQK